MAINAGDARLIADGTGTDKEVSGTGITISNIDEGTGTVFDVYSQVIPNVITNGQSHEVRYVCVYLRNITAGGTPITITNISIGNEGNHNFRLDNHADFPLLNVQGNTLVPGDTTASAANTSFIKLNDGGTNFVVDDGDAQLERTEYIDGVNRILDTTIPAEKYRCFIVAEIPNKETINGITQNDGLVLVVDGVTITFDLTSSTVSGMNIGQFVVHDLNDLNATQLFRESPVFAEEVDQYFGYDANLATVVNSPLIINWDGTTSEIKDSANISTLLADKEYFGCKHNSVIIGFRSVAQNLAAENGLQIIANSSLINNDIKLTQGDTYAVDSESEGHTIKNSVFYISDIAPNAPTLAHFSTTHDNAGADNFSNVLTDKYFLIEATDRNVTIAPENSSQVNRTNGLMYLVYRPNAQFPTTTVISGQNTPLTHIGTGIKLNSNKVYFAHVSGNSFTKSAVAQLDGTVTGVRGTIASATTTGTSHNSNDDGGITKQTNTNLISDTITGIQFNYSKLLVKAGVNLNLDTLLSSSNTSVQTITGDISSVNLSSSTSEVADGGVVNITVSAPSSLSSLTFNTSTLSFNPADGVGSVDIFPPAVSRTAVYTDGSTGDFVSESFSLDYTNVYSKNPTQINRNQFRTLGWFLENGETTSPTPFTIDMGRMNIRPMEAECMLVSFDPTQSKFAGHADTTNTSQVVGDSGYEAGSGKNEGIVITPGLGVPRDAWLSSLNGRSIELHSVRNQYDGTTDASITNANSYGNIAHPNTFNEFGAVIDANGVDSTATGTRYNISNGVLAYKTQSSPQINSGDNYYHHLGQVAQADASTNNNTPFFPLVFSGYAKDATTKIPTGFQTLDTAYGGAMSTHHYQNIRTLWIYNPGGERIRVLNITLTDFEYKNGGAGVDEWEKISDQTSGTSYDPNVIFMSQTESNAHDSSSAVSSPIKIVVPKIGDTSPMQADTEDVVAFVDSVYTTYTATTNKNAAVLSPTHEFRSIPSVDDNYESGAAANSAMRPNSAGTSTAKCIPIHCFFDHIFIDNSDIKEGNSVLSLSGLPANGQVNALLKVEYCSDTDVASSTLSDKGATNVLGDLTASDNTTLDPKIATQEITVRLSMNFVATGGTLSITDEDNDAIISGANIQFSV